MFSQNYLSGLETSIITVTSADESEVDISEAVEKVTGTNWGITP